MQRFGLTDRLRSAVRGLATRTAETPFVSVELPLIVRFPFGLGMTERFAGEAIDVCGAGPFPPAGANA